MNYSIRFETAKFDVTREDANPINPTRGQSLLLWLKDKLAGQVQFDGLDAEDWGWYTTVEWNGRDYLLGASAMEADADHYEWVFQVDKHRSFHEKLSGREKMTRNDECLQFFKQLFDAESDFEHVAIE
jgi:hypothetical protein